MQCWWSRCSIADPRVDQGVGDIDQQIDQHIEEAEQQHDTLNDRIVQIGDGVDLFKNHYAQAKSLYPNAAEKLVFNEAVKSIFDTLVGDLITHTKQRVQSSSAHSLEDIRSYRKRLAAFSPPVEKQRRRLKEFLYENLYYSPALAPEKEDAERITSELFAHWMEEPDDLPRNYREKSAHDSLPRVICDYIAGMTDPFIYQQYEKYCCG